jgi:hypothetical protein
MQLELDLAAVIEPDMTPEEIEAIAADFLDRYSSDVRTNGALRPTPCWCAPDGIGHFRPRGLREALYQVRQVAFSCLVFEARWGSAHCPLL